MPCFQASGEMGAAMEIRASVANALHKVAKTCLGCHPSCCWGATARRGSKQRDYSNVFSRSERRQCRSGGRCSPQRCQRRHFGSSRNPLVDLASNFCGASPASENAGVLRRPRRVRQAHRRALRARRGPFSRRLPSRSARLDLGAVHWRGLAAAPRCARKARWR